MIGDIILDNNACYVFILKEIEKYIINNLTYVGKNEVQLEKISIKSDEIKNISVKYKDVNIIVPSLRADAVISSLYNLSRNEVKNKIEAGDLVINSREMYFVSEILRPNDIVSVRKCGKFKVRRNNKSI